MLPEESGELHGELASRRLAVAIRGNHPQRASNLEFVELDTTMEARFDYVFNRLQLRVHPRFFHRDGIRRDNLRVVRVRWQRREHRQR